MNRRALLGMSLIAVASVSAAPADVRMVEVTGEGAIR